MKINDRIQKLQNEISKYNIDAYLILNNDAHNNEYLPDYAKIIEWFTGFTGSAATLVVTKDFCGLWTDSRYFIQAEKQLEGSGVELQKLQIPHITEYFTWLNENLAPGSCIGFDGNLVPVYLYEQLKERLSSKVFKYKSNFDLISPIWENRPNPPSGEIILLDEKFAGQNALDKLNKLKHFLTETKKDALIISTLDDIAWLLNVRGSDIKYNPYVISYLLVSCNEIVWFVDKSKIIKYSSYFDSINVKMHDYNDFYPFVEKIAQSHSFIVEKEKTSTSLFQLIDKTKNDNVENIVANLKSIKNKTERNGMRSAHIKDGVAMVKFLYWFRNERGSEEHDEVTIAKKLESFRREQELFYDLSFGSIVGFNENGAIVHYTATEESAKEIATDGILLIDSGGQYFDGTTDITRTIATGKPTQQQKDDYTLVLKGMINLSRLKFPEGTKGHHVDVLARQYLWQHGFNYGHGTGHGVGAFLGVHEGPQGVSPRVNNTDLQAGMVLSNEPGIYREGEYGIRIENLILIEESEKTPFGNFLEFETLTLCPFDLNLINESLLSNDEKIWINKYHQKVREVLSPFLSTNESKWLESITQAILET